MEFFKNTNIDFLGKKWYFLGFSLVFSVAGILSMLLWHGIPMGVDFKGGSDVYVKFATTPNNDAIRTAMDQAGLHNTRIQRFGAAANNEVLIALEQKETSEQALDEGKLTIIRALASNPPPGKLDLNNASTANLQDDLVAKDPLHLGIATDASQRYAGIAKAVMDYRNKDKSGVLLTFDELRKVAPAEVVSALQNDFYISNYAVRNVEIVGPQVGKQLQKQAILAVLYSLAGMLVYLWFRFEMIYGVAAVVAVFHDTLITLGAFSLTNQEITLTVIAAILTLVGYSMNDTIVVFDRIRENVKLLRREPLAGIVNKSINQTLSRTILTSGLTFLTVLSLYMLGGAVLHGFSFALVIGILIGTYSSIAVAAPMLVAYQDWRSARSGRSPVPVMADASSKEKVKMRAKA